MLLGFVSGTVSALYHLWLATPLAELRTDLNLDIWPHSWPLVAQLFVMFLMSEFLWYWIHRAEHRWNMVWRVSGHGAHHSFKTLGALNFGLNHPLELFFLLLPSILLELIFGIGAVAAGAAAALAGTAGIRVRIPCTLRPPSPHRPLRPRGRLPPEVLGDPRSAVACERT